MNRFVALLRLITALLLLGMALVTAHNLFSLASRPETISVVHAMIGQGLLIICLAALATLLIRRAWNQLKAPGKASQKPESPSRSPMRP